LLELSFQERVTWLEEGEVAVRVLGAAGIVPGAGVGVGAALKVLALATLEYVENAPLFEVARTR
jgi:hypothetical protein